MTSALLAPFRKYARIENWGNQSSLPLRDGSNMVLRSKFLNGIVLETLTSRTMPFINILFVF